MLELHLNRPTPRSVLDLLAGAAGPMCRSRRVVLLLAATMVMSAADLAMTLTYATSIGMMEANPIARAVMASGSPLMLAVWKAATVGLGLGILFVLRRQRKAELGAWICFLVMCALTAHWVAFNVQITSCTEEYAALATWDGDDPHWVMMTATQ